MSGKLSTLAVAALLGLGVVTTATVATADPVYQVVATETRRVGPLVLTEETVQVGNDPVDRFTLHRVAKEQPGAGRGALLLMPGGGSNFDFYLAAEPGQDEKDSFAGYFALRGIEVWGYSPRTRGLAPGACSGGVDCSAMAAWGMRTVVEDALYIRERMRQVLGTDKPVIGGLSLGAMSALAVMDASPGDWAGAIVWEGMIYSADPVVRAGNQVSCDEATARIAGGELADETNYPLIRLLYELAVADPGGPTPLPGFPPGFTNRQVFLALLTTPQPTPPGYVPGYTLVVGSVAEDGFTFSSEERLAMLILRLNHYEPLALIRDYTCALAGERTFSSNLGSFTAPVYAVGGGQSFGSWMGDNLALLGSTDVTWNFVPELGHADHFASPDHRRLLEKPMFDWLKRVLAER